jgi:hypothetical protein
MVRIAETSLPRSAALKSIALKIAAKRDVPSPLEGEGCKSKHLNLRTAGEGSVAMAIEMIFSGDAKRDAPSPLEGEGCNRKYLNLRTAGEGSVALADRAPKSNTATPYIFAE